MTTRFSLAWCGVLALLVACFAPQYPAGLPCSERQTCPPGQTCDGELCQLAVIDAATGDALAADAPIVDASPLDVDASPPDIDASPPDDAAVDGSPDARAAVCQNGVVEDGEMCDGDGIGNGGETRVCDDDCTLPSCGDGNHNPSFDPGNGLGGEQCDDGNASDSDSCVGRCALARCTDGHVGPGEECDDGNANDGDDCTTSCRLTTCGDGIVQSAGATPEDCDDGNSSDDRNGCSPDCRQNSVCGNAVVEFLFEGCDDGNSSDNGNGCSSTCQRNNDCGNGVLEALYEECDEGDLNGHPLGCCTADCRLVVPTPHCI